MKAPALVQQLSAGIESAIRSGKFCVSGTLPNVNPDIQVTDFGRLKVPLQRAVAKRLMAVCDPAPYGQGTKTLVNPKVRNAFELSPERFILTNPQWDQEIAAVVCSAAERLGLPADRLEARLYKLLLYGTGGFFLPHRDSEKHDRMVASLIVALPCEFSGGALTVRHQNVAQEMQFKEAATEKAPCYAAFYADCEHEVARVDAGFRLCLAYNLLLQGAPSARKPKATGGAARPAEALAGSMAAWVAVHPSEPLVFALDHHYTERGLAVDLLKGTDRDIADLVLAAADHAGCLAYLCQVSRHTIQQADDGNWGHHRRFADEDDEDDDGVPADVELGEIFEDDLLGEQWVGPDGSRQLLPTIAFDPAAIIARTPLDAWKPTRQEYEGFTGNAGNTLDRWYHRSAVCVWHCDYHFDVLAVANIQFAITTLETMVKNLKTAPKRAVELLTAALIMHRFCGLRI